MLRGKEVLEDVLESVVQKLYGLPQTIFHLHVSYTCSDGSEEHSVCAGEQHTEAHKREKAKVFSKFFILQNNELTCINQAPPSSNIGSHS